MAKLIEEIEKMSEEGKTVDETDDGIELLHQHKDEIGALLDLLKTAHESGILTILKGLFENKGPASTDLSEELAKPKNIRFVRNLMSIYTLLSNIDPDTVRVFMLNLARAVDKSGSMKERGPMGLLAMRSQMMDPDVAVGFRVLFEVAKGFTKPGDRKE